MSSSHQHSRNPGGVLCRFFRSGGESEFILVNPVHGGQETGRGGEADRHRTHRLAGVSSLCGGSAGVTQSLLGSIDAVSEPDALAEGASEHVGSYAL